MSKLRHFHITGSSFADGRLTVDGEDFPYPVSAVRWALDRETGFPELTVTIQAARVTIDTEPLPGDAA